MDITKMALVAAGLFAAHRFAPHPIVKGAVISIGAIIVAKKIPYLNEMV